jgi:hypothetical protein
MALKGAYTYAGINISEAYVKVTNVKWDTTFLEQSVEKTPAVFDKDGAKILEPAVFENKVLEKKQTTYDWVVYKDKSERDASPKNSVEHGHDTFTMAVNTSAKNAVEQAYEALKTKDAFKDMVEA